MGTEMKRRHPPSLIPDDIRQVFEIADIVKVFEYMESFFHLSKDFRKIYAYQLKEQMRSISEQEYFFIYMRENIEPHINAILKQDDCLNRIVRYLLKNRIEERKINAGYRKRF